ncbi:hypothetical protein DENSPDRAFT_855096 [Dentipellis sp. KUC8613]|nr:hypothetical protein DENSPDRAFT_855096 [Dentipellis sp. KUC8613]
MGIPLDRAVFIALFVETITYGICVTMSAVTTLLFMRVKAEGGIADKRLLGVLLLMLVLATVHVILSFVRMFNAFFRSHGLTPATYLANLSNPVFVGKNTVLVLQTILGDGVNIWRCFVVYNSKIRAIVAPLVVMLAGIVAGCFVLATLAQSSESTTIFSNPNRWIKAYDVFMMSTNVYCTVAIAFKIWITGSHKTSLGNLLPVMVAIVETGALYTASLIAFLITYLAESNGQYVAIDIVTPLVPSIFCLIILQVKFHKAGPHVFEVSTPHQSKEQSRISFGGLRRALKLGKTPNNMGVSTFQMQPVAIQISTEAEEHYPGEEHPRMSKKDPDNDFRDV